MEKEKSRERKRAIMGLEFQREQEAAWQLTYAPF